ncbi:MAG: glutamate-5-semialdehyde dehydrogenase [Tannerellaceae bacterium]|jgi:glutamate-5-semialdehyde dehydrogenase|nr:glutamate-5-semialdehyde dehydrogenase [Tannerellaceae bacterium]
MNTQELLVKAAGEKQRLVMCGEERIRATLVEASRLLSLSASDVLDSNMKDLERMPASDPRYDRLKLTASRLGAIAGDMRKVSSKPSPTGGTLSAKVCGNGMKISKVSVPFGVVGVIYEARPNVTCDVFSLCLKSRNVCVLKGGSDAQHTNAALVSLIHEAMKQNGIDTASCTLLPSGREATATLLAASDLVDLIIPRGSSALIRFVRDNTHIPVIETGAGICHMYFDKDGDMVKGRDIVNNAKTRRVSVCNALDCLIVHESRLSDLPFICEYLALSNVIIYADAPSYEVLSGRYPFLKRSTADSYGTEFLDYKMSIRTVASLDEATSHIALHGSRHSECIVSESHEAIKAFVETVDAACVYANVSTTFTDGAQFGMGSEIGISTQKLHARGPMGLHELTTYKYIIEGDGQIRTP